MEKNIKNITGKKRKIRDDRNMGTYWDLFSSGVIDYAKEAFSSFDPWVYPIFLLGLVGLMYAYTHSVVVAAAGIIVVVGLYGSNVFASVPDVMLIMYMIVLISIAVLFTVLFIKRRN